MKNKKSNNKWLYLMVVTVVGFIVVLQLVMEYVIK
jgi:hypothetical protein